MRYVSNLLGYDVFLIESIEDCRDLYKVSLHSSIDFLGFDTETNTLIDMSKQDGDNIDIKHDLPFLIQFGYLDKIYLYDVRFHDNKTTEAFLKVFDSFCKHSKLALAHNIKFDINMLWNKGYEWYLQNACDTMSIARLALESKSEREGGYPMALKPLASRLLGSEYALAGKELDMALRAIWTVKLKELARLLKPYGITRRQINDVLKDVAGDISEFPLEVQDVWNDWESKSRVSYADINPELLYKYGATDVILVLELAKRLLPIVSAKGQMKILKREMRLILPLVKMERTGYTVDKQYLIDSKQRIIEELNKVKDENIVIAGEKIAPNQHQAIKNMLLSKYNYTLESTDKNRMHIIMQTDATMPEEVKKYLENVIYLRTLEKWISTYINPMLFKLNLYGDTKVYTMYNPNGAVSGRFTSNFQQFPKNAIKSKYDERELFHPRKMFIVDKDYPELAYIDYSQVELRLQAEYTYYCTYGEGDINMLRAYMPFKCHKDSEGNYIHDEDNAPWQGIDLHTQSTMTAFPDVERGTPEFKKLRSVGKRVNFALIYGASLKKVKETLADTDPEVVTQLYTGFHNRFKDVRTYNNWVSNSWFQHNGFVQNLMGRRYYINESRDVYKLNNYLIQGSAADIIKCVIIRIDEFLTKKHYKTRLQGCIHDELCICVAEGEHNIIYEIKRMMETTCKTFVPLVAEISITSTNWAEKHEEEK